MDAVLFVGVIVGLFFFVLSIFLLVRTYALSKNASSLVNESTALRDEFRGIVRRVHSLEKAFENLRPDAERTGSGISEPLTNANVAKPVVIPADHPTPEPQPVALPALATPKLAASRTIGPPPIPQPAAPQRRASSLIPHPTPTTFDSARTPEPHRWADLEERLGANWLNKIGTAAFVIGVALLLNYSTHYLGPRGKIGLGYALSVGFLVAGILSIGCRANCRQ